MKTSGNSKSFGREDLKKYFRNGQIPTENHFGYMIDSMINKQDDAFLKDKDNGLVIATMGASKRFISLFKNINELNPFFTLEKDEQGVESLKLNPIQESEKFSDDASFYFNVNGGLGIGKRCEEEHRLDVDGFIGIKGRVGTYVKGNVPADGKWQTILENLDNCTAFEVIARTGKRGSGKFAILHAHALSAFGNSRSGIRKTSAHSGFFWNRLRLRFMGTTHNYRLEIKTGNNYGSGVDIFFNISKLWDDKMFMPKEYYNSF